LLLHRLIGRPLLDGGGLRVRTCRRLLRAILLVPALLQLLPLLSGRRLGLWALRLHLRLWRLLGSRRRGLLRLWRLLGRGWWRGLLRLRLDLLTLLLLLLLSLLQLLLPLLLIVLSLLLVLLALLLILLPLFLPFLPFFLIGVFILIVWLVILRDNN
jgi:hypothetical protein